MTVDRLVTGREIRVLEELTAVSTESLDVLVVCLTQPPLQAPVHRPVSEKCKKMHVICESEMAL